MFYLVACLQQVARGSHYLEDSGLEKNTKHEISHSYLSNTKYKLVTMVRVINKIGNKTDSILPYEILREFVFNSVISHLFAFRF